jgi:hypothetical protein
MADQRDSESSERNGSHDAALLLPWGAELHTNLEREHAKRCADQGRRASRNPWEGAEISVLDARAIDYRASILVAIWWYSAREMM